MSRTPARALLLALLAFAAVAAAQDYPRKPLRLIVPFSPGGGNDTVARAIGSQLAAQLGQPVLIDNRAGAGGIVGAELAAHSAPDGYTLFLGGVGSLAVNPNLHAHLPYDALKDFAPITLLASAPSVLVAHPSIPAATIQAFTAYARANPGKLNYASNGNGSSAQLAAVLYESMAGVRMVHVPYKGLAPALVDLLAGQVQLMFSSMVAILPHIKAGRLRALAVTGRERSALLPEVPTLAESGLPGYEAGSWYGILAPAGTPAPIVARLHEELVRALQDPQVRERLAAEGAQTVGSSPAEFERYIAAESARTGKLLRDANIRME
ncbi:MAG TPA: tripartite tricarboxylate transporter substrate binding protein [Burkholderiales bacterium]|nr:tripartite tricarboxylate transporter substrate binding protein [Burkholderiales bacterium]